MAHLVTMQTLARKAGVSVMTVSRSLNNSPLVRAGLRKKIQHLAKRLGYRPNPMVNALMTTRRKFNTLSSTIAWVDGKKYREHFDGDLTIQGMLKGVKEEASVLGFNVDCFHGWTYKDGKQLTRVLKNRGIRGIVFGYPSDLETDLILDWDNFVCIKMIRFYPSARLHQIHGNTIHTINLHLNTLRQYGYGRIGLAVCRAADNTSDNITTSFFHKYQSNLPAKRRIPIFYPEYNISYYASSSQKDGLYRWYDKNRPDVIVSGFNLDNDLKSFGVSVPDDVAWSDLYVRVSDGSIAGTVPGHNKQGKAAVRFLAEQLYVNNYGLPPIPYTVMITCSEWVDGATVPVRKALNK